MSELPWYLRLYDETYFSGGRSVSGYDEYMSCRGVLQQWSSMVEREFKPSSVLDVAAAYGFVVEYFRNLGRDADGIEPSPYALSRAVVPGLIAGALPDLPATPRETYQVVTCTECLEHVPENLVPASLAALAAKTQPGGHLVLLVMLEGPGADGDDGHICLKSREWWESALDAAGLVREPEPERRLNEDPYSVGMYWSRRLFVRRA